MKKMTKNITELGDLKEGQTVIDVQKGIAIEVVAIKDETVTLETEYGSDAVTHSEIETLIEMDAIRPRTELDLVDSILDNLGEPFSEEKAWRLARGPAGKEDEIRSYPMTPI